MLNNQLLDLYTDYVIASFSLTTATGLSADVNEQYRHDQITRFLAKEDYRQKSYWQCIKSIVRQIEQDDGIIVVDDTIAEKPYPDENDIVCWHDDHPSEQNVKGINLVNFLDQVERPDGQAVSLPLAYELVSKPETVVDTKTGKTKRKSAISKNTWFGNG